MLSVDVGAFLCTILRIIISHGMLCALSNYLRAVIFLGTPIIVIVTRLVHMFYY